MRAFKFVKDIMTSSVHTVSPDLPLSEALRVMGTNRIHRLPVVQNLKNEPLKMVGIITDRDLRLAADSPFLHEPAKEVFDKLSKHKVKEIMHTSVISVEEETPIVDAAKIMRVSKVGGLPVVNNNGNLVGICTRSDLLDHLIRLLEPATGSGGMKGLVEE